MQKICLADWYLGVHIYDFFYQLQRQSVNANASMDMICAILVSQLPKVIQNRANNYMLIQKGIMTKMP